MDAAAQPNAPIPCYQPAHPPAPAALQLATGLRCSRRCHPRRLIPPAAARRPRGGARCARRGWGELGALTRGGPRRGQRGFRFPAPTACANPSSRRAPRQAVRNMSSVSQSGQATWKQTICDNECSLKHTTNEVGTLKYAVCDLDMYMPGTAKDEEASDCTKLLATPPPTSGKPLLMRLLAGWSNTSPSRRTRHPAPSTDRASGPPTEAVPENTGPPQ